METMNPGKAGGLCKPQKGPRTGEPLRKHWALPACITRPTACKRAPDASALHAMRFSLFPILKAKAVFLHPG